MKWFITYGDEKFEAAKAKLTKEADATGEFDKIISYGKADLSEELLKTDIINIPRGGGLWSWKPDVLWKTLQLAEENDIIVYCDSGCSLQKSNEWNTFWELLEKYDLIAQRLRKRTDKWTRKEVLDYFISNGEHWGKCYQYLATVVIIVNNKFTRSFVNEWRDLILKHPEFVMDVTQEERIYQHKCLKENRHDQTIYSALIYKYRNNKDTKSHIFTQWEHIEDYDIFSRQAIRATRLRFGEKESNKILVKRIVKRLVKDYITKPFYYIPLQQIFGKNL